MTEKGPAAEPAPTRRRRGPNDPDRRDRIARAAISVVAERGIDALTHRAVAAAAGVPLGSTTYHYATFDDLLAAAFDQAARRSVAHLHAWERGLPADVDLADAIAGYIVESLVEKRDDTVAEYNLYALALQRPSLRGAAAAWDSAVADLFIARTDELTGRVIATLTCGLLMQAVLSPEPPARADVAAMFRRALCGGHSA